MLDDEQIKTSSSTRSAPPLSSEPDRDEALDSPPASPSASPPWWRRRLRALLRDFDDLLSAGRG